MRGTVKYDFIEFIVLFIGASVMALAGGAIMGAGYGHRQASDRIMKDAIEADEAHYCVDNHEWKFQWEQCDG